MRTPSGRDGNPGSTSTQDAPMKRRLRLQAREPANTQIGKGLLRKRVRFRTALSPGVDNVSKMIDGAEDDISRCDLTLLDRVFLIQHVRRDSRVVRWSRFCIGEAICPIPSVLFCFRMVREIQPVKSGNPMSGASLKAWIYAATTRWPSTTTAWARRHSSRSPSWVASSDGGSSETS